MSNSRPDFDQRLVKPDVGRAQRAAAAGDEPQRRAVDEAEQPLDVAAPVHRHVMMHRDCRQRSQRAVPVIWAAVRVQQHQAARLGR